MKIITLITLLLGITVMGIHAQDQTQSKTPKILVAYFSWSGHTRGIAMQIHEQVGGDLFEIVPVTPYSTDYDTCLDEAKRDLRQQARRPLKTHVENMDSYDVVFLGYPNWWSSIPMPVATFLQEYNFKGKTIIPFCSHGGSRLGDTVAAVTKLCPQSTILESLSVREAGGNSLRNDIAAWLRRIGQKPK